MIAPEKVAIIGKAPSSRGLAPYGDESWEIWTLSNLVLAKEVPRWSRHVEIHPLSWFDQGNGEAPYIDWMASIQDKPIYMQEEYPAIPSAVRFPKAEIVEHFGTYFTNTVSWMIALAILEGAKEIGVWGVDMAQNTEYETQRPSCEFFLGWAAGAGIKVTVPPQADMLKCRKLYGYDSEGEMYNKWKARSKELRQRLNNKTAERDNAAMEAAFLQGALEAQDWVSQWI